jgi:hypothetical protein
MPGTVEQTAHGSQVLCPAAGAVVLLAHAAHDSCPAASWWRPAAQATHPVAAASACARPAPHRAHAALPPAAANVPGTQSVQSTAAAASVDRLPAAQLPQTTAAAALASANLPPGHAPHDERLAALWKKPAAQAMQRTGATAPSVLSPGAQPTQKGCAGELWCLPPGQLAQAVLLWFDW